MSRRTHSPAHAIGVTGDDPRLPEATERRRRVVDPGRDHNEPFRGSAKSREPFMNSASTCATDGATWTTTHDTGWSTMPPKVPPDTNSMGSSPRRRRRTTLRQPTGGSRRPRIPGGPAGNARAGTPGRRTHPARSSRPCPSRDTWSRPRRWCGTPTSSRSVSTCGPPFAPAADAVVTTAAITSAADTTVHRFMRDRRPTGAAGCRARRGSSSTRRRVPRAGRRLRCAPCRRRPRRRDRSARSPV